MIMKKKLTLILALLLIVAVAAGCAQQQTTAPTQGTTTTPGTETTGTTAPSGPSIDFDEEPYVVNLQLVALFEKNTDLEKIEEAINVITLAKVNAKVDIQQIFIGDLKEKTSLAVAGDEKIDLITVGLTQRLETLAPDGILLELDDLLAERGQGILELIGNYKMAGVIDGETLAVTAMPFPASAGGFVYNKAMADDLGIVIPDRATMADITAAFAKVKEADVYGTINGGGLLMYKFYKNMQVYGNNGAYGVILDPINSTKIENVFASAEYKEYLEMTKNWADAGYNPADAMTNTTPGQQYFSEQKIFGLPTGFSPDQYKSWQAGRSFEIAIAQMDDAVISTSSVTEVMYGIASNCKRPDKAMDILNLIYTDTEIGNLLNYGLENLNYKRVAGTDSVITAEGAESGPDGYRIVFSRFGNPLNNLAMSPLTDTYYDDLKAFNAAAKVTKDFGYAFDPSPVAAEGAQIANVIAEYMPLLESGFATDLDAQLAALLAALDSAGMADVIAENQAQLDAFLAGK
jgi:putative aldouronate transport system substrate-binding protein